MAEVQSKEDDSDVIGGDPVLVVEDLEENRELAQAMLQKAGFHVDCVANGLEAVDAVQTTPYSLVLMDVQMPKMDGISATRAIRNLPPPACDVPVIAMTANVLSQQLAEFRAAGMNDRLGKPYTRSGLLAKVRQWQAIRGSEQRDPPQIEPEPERSASPSVRSPDEVVFDPGAVAGARELLGNAWVSESARRLRTGIEEALWRTGPDQPVREDLARDAHKLVSQASQLGFFELARYCRDLEEACSGDSETEAALAEARSAADRISGELNGLADGRSLESEAAPGKAGSSRASPRA